MYKINDFYQESLTKSNTREKVLAVALELFSEQGMDGVTMIDIAKTCDITQRTLYRYYNSKEFLAMDAAYVVMTGSMQPIRLHEDGKTGLQQLEIFLKHRFQEEALGVGIKKIRFIMYFDIYISKLSQDHPALQRYVTVYRKHINEPGYNEVTKILKEGIKDGSIHMDDSEVDFYRVYLIQSIMSVVMRTIVKESENETINRSLVDKQIEIILTYLGR